MITKYIQRDEWYPFYDLTDSESFMSFSIELSEEEYEKYCKLMDQVYAWQAILRKRYEFCRGKK